MAEVLMIDPKAAARIAFVVMPRCPGCGESVLTSV